MDLFICTQVSCFCHHIVQGPSPAPLGGGVGAGIVQVEAVEEEAAAGGDGDRDFARLHFLSQQLREVPEMKQTIVMAAGKAADAAVFECGVVERDPTGDLVLGDEEGPGGRVLVIFFD